MTFRDEYIAERAAIMEFDAGLPRAEAERRAAAEWVQFAALWASRKGGLK